MVLNQLIKTDMPQGDLEKDRGADGWTVRHDPGSRPT